MLAIHYNDIILYQNYIWYSMAFGMAEILNKLHFEVISEMYTTFSVFS